MLRDRTGQDTSGLVRGDVDRQDKTGQDARGINLSGCGKGDPDRCRDQAGFKAPSSKKVLVCGIGKEFKGYQVIIFKAA